MPPDHPHPSPRSRTGSCASNRRLRAVAWPAGRVVADLVIDGDENHRHLGHGSCETDPVAVGRDDRDANGEPSAQHPERAGGRGPVRRARTRQTSEVTEGEALAEDVGLTPRVLARVRSDFPGAADSVVNLLAGVESGSQDRERVVAAVVLSADSQVDALLDAIELSHVDWRDVLVNGGLADDGWEERLNQLLGPLPTGWLVRLCLSVRPSPRRA